MLAPMHRFIACLRGACRVSSFGFRMPKHRFISLHVDGATTTLSTPRAFLLSIQALGKLISTALNTPRTSVCPADTEPRSFPLS